MRITYGRTAYVATNSDTTLDGIENFPGLNGWATGDGNFCTSREEFISALDGVKEADAEPLNEHEKKIYDYLMQVNNALKGEVGDIVFHN